ncbi:MAG: hypothetical protein ACJAT3_000031 [Akkermansiaceae bacterium]|jgi:hypothetical protein
MKSSSSSFRNEKACEGLEREFLLSQFRIELADLELFAFELYRGLLAKTAADCQLRFQRPQCRGASQYHPEGVFSSIPYRKGMSFWNLWQ